MRAILIYNKNNKNNKKYKNIKKNTKKSNLYDMSLLKVRHYFFYLIYFCNINNNMIVTI